MKRIVTVTLSVTAEFVERENASQTLAMALIHAANSSAVMFGTGPDSTVIEATIERYGETRKVPVSVEVLTKEA